MIIKVKAKIKNLEETEKASMLLKKEKKKYHKKQMVVSKRKQLKARLSKESPINN